MSEHVKDSLFLLFSIFLQLPFEANPYRVAYMLINAPVRLLLPSAETTQAGTVPGGRQWPVESHRIRQMDTHQ